MEQLVAEICLENTAYAFDRPFSYAVPAALAQKAQPGCRVLVPFGRANSKRQGMILSVSAAAQMPANWKEIAEVLDESPLLHEELLGMVFWLKERYFCTLFEAVHLLLPAGLNLKVKHAYRLAQPLTDEILQCCTETEQQILRYLEHRKKPVREDILCKDLGLDKAAALPEKLFQRGLLHKHSGAVRNIGDLTTKMVRLTGDPARKKLTPRQREVFQALEAVGAVSVKELCYFTGVTPSVVDNLVKYGAAEYFEEAAYRTPYGQIASANAEAVVLSEQQQLAFDTLFADYQKEEAVVSLLYGVTGSGKTQVFLRLIDEALRRGDGVIMMVPEISLTPQMVARFHQRYGREVAVFHSGLSLGERLDEWKRVKNGEAKIALGTRSAVFAPLARVGLILLDEEQEHTYKSEMSPRFHAREVAKYRCAYHKGLLVLASATPSIETAYAAQTKRYHYASMPERYGDAKLPQVIVADMNEEQLSGNTTLFSHTLLTALHETLAAGEQAILLLNRRGYHPFAVCRSCKEVVTCPHCSISLTYHAANHRLLCHYCGYSIPFTDVCPSCQQREVRFSGVGTQKIEEQLGEFLPQARILRMDADSTMRRGDYEKHLAAFGRGEYDLMVGTQMVAKGLNFPNVTLVGVLSADQSLYSDDFRSSERTFDLLTQVVGRSGRGDKAGRAVIQTFLPEHPVIALAAAQDYPQFYRQEIAFRKAMLYPPFADLVTIGFVGTSETLVQQAGLRFLELLSALAAAEYAHLPMRVLRPSPALIAKISNKYRYRLIIKCKNDRRLRELLSRLLVQFSKEAKFKTVTVFADTAPDMV